VSRITVRLLPLLFLFYSGSAGAQQPDRPPILNLGDAVVTGFSGTVAPDPTKPLPRNKSAVDLTFINPDGPSARIVDIGGPGYVWDGRLLAAPKTFDVFAKDVGQIFGIALDDQTAPNIYLAATSVFGLQIVLPGRTRDSIPERLKKGRPGAVWMKGQFGLDLQGGPGSVWRVDGRTGEVSLFANVTLDGVPNPGPGLGNLAYDSAHKQLFVSDLYTGVIHRFDLDGRELGSYDHGVIGRVAAQLPALPFDPRNRLNIANERFDSENPDTWGFAPPERRVWGLAVQESRLFYSVRNGSATDRPQIWSVGIQQDGSFASDPRWELDVPGQPGPYPVSDIAFSQKGAMILAQRAAFAGSYDYSAFTRPGEPRVLRYWLKDPNDPPSPGRWKPLAEEYAIGFAGNYRNTNGGVALGYGYGPDGTLSAAACEFSLWTTAQNMRNAPPLRSQLEPGGPLVVHGIHGVPAAPVRNFNEPPWTSYSIDYDDTFDDPRAMGHLGSVRIFTTPCVGPVAAYGGPGYVSSPPYISGSGGGGGACFAPTSLSLPPCARPGRAVSLDLGTATSGVDSNWTVSPGGPSPYHTSLGAWTALANNWVQPAQSSTANSNAAAGTYTYTRRFNLPCSPNSYQQLQLTGRFAADNSATVSLNGHPLNTCVGPFCFNNPILGTPFTYSGTTFFNQGPNSLTVTVGNQTSSYTGLSVTAKLDAICGSDCVCGCPPGTLLLGNECVPSKPIDLKIGKENTAQGGSGTWFNLWVTNVGAPITFPAGGITVTDVIPAGMTFTGLAGTGAGWTCTPPPLVGPNTLTCTYNLAGSLNTGQQLLSSIIVHYTTTGPGPFQNCATVGISPAVGVDGNPANNTACVTVTGTPIDLAIAKTGGTSPAAQVNAYGFNLTVTNIGAAFTGANVITVTDVVPAGMTFNAATGPNWTCATLPASAGSTITCTYTGTGPTAPNQSLGTINITATALGSSPYPPFTNCATVGILPASGLQDTNAQNNTACVTVTKPPLCAPPLVLNAAGNCVCSPDAAQNGGVGSLTITKAVTNNAPLGFSTTWGFNISCTGPSNTTTSAVVYGNNASTTVNNIPACSTCTVTEVPRPGPSISHGNSICPAGTFVVLEPPTYTPSSVVIGGAPANIVVNNTLNCSPVPPSTCPSPLVPDSNGECNCPPGMWVPVAQCVPGSPSAISTPAACPQGTVRTTAGICVPLIACRPPRVLNPATGQCDCPRGTTLRGNECARQLVCPPPMVANAAGTACGCPSGFIARGLECIRSPGPVGPVVRPIVCNPPAVANAAGTACVCPANMMASGNGCIERGRQPSFTLPGVIPGPTPPRGGESPPGPPRGGGDNPLGPRGR
jgi:hypothetical protein